jgi:hypothetical protein
MFTIYVWCLFNNVLHVSYHVFGRCSTTSLTILTCLTILLYHFGWRCFTMFVFYTSLTILCWRVLQLWFTRLTCVPLFTVFKTCCWHFFNVLTMLDTVFSYSSYMLTIFVRICVHKKSYKIRQQKFKYVRLCVPFKLEMNLTRAWCDSGAHRLHKLRIGATLHVPTAPLWNQLTDWHKM